MAKLQFFTTITFFVSFTLSAQVHTALPHGMVFGQKVNAVDNMPASKVEAFMGTKTRISTTIVGKVMQVDTPKGGWFRMDAGNGKVIRVHFKDYGVTLPTALKGHTVMIEGVAQKNFIADDMQHLAGDTVNGKKQHHVNANPKERVTFEATGLMVE